MRNIIIVQCASTGFNYVQDIADRNYNPVILEMKFFMDNEMTEKHRKDVRDTYKLITADYDLIYEKDTYEETLEMVRKLNPLLIVPGTEDGVILATRLANDLDLLCNPIENIDAMTLKDAMQKRLAENNLRHIRGKIVNNLEEAIKFYDEEKLSEVVLKPVYGAGSVGVHICLNKTEMIEKFEEIVNEIGYYGSVQDNILVQERIKGEEYFVNTTSCDGVHRVTGIWKYEKITTPEGNHIYDTIRTVNELGIRESEMVEYAYDVADAIGIKYGPVHGEYMIDENGPVLIEVNCRPHGCTMEAKYLDPVFGQHETDSILDSYLNPKKFHLERLKGYKPFGHAALKLFITPKDLIAKSTPMIPISRKLKSYYSTDFKPLTEDTPFEKTQNLKNSSGIVYLSNEDPYQLQKDIELLRSIEKNAFQLVLSEELDRKIKFDKNTIHKDLKSFIDEIEALGTCLLITDTIYDDLNATQITPQQLKETEGKFDTVIVNLNDSLIEYSDEIEVSFILNTLDRIKNGGLLIIPQSTFKLMPNGRIGAEALVKTLDLKIELPLHQYPKMLIASKR
ncbi:ATP-grasp domain-containing protein [Methanobrevibacter sp.]